MKIAVGYLVSYDYPYLLHSLRSLYEHVDDIVLSVDRDGLTWSGNAVTIPDSFFEQVAEYDTDKKIRYHRDSFYRPDLSPSDCDTRQRNLLSQCMGDGCWQLQVDVDEYFVDFTAFKQFLGQHSHLLTDPASTPVSIRLRWVTLFKQLANGFLYIDNGEPFAIATNLVGRHSYCREFRDVSVIQADFAVVHQSWARDEAEIAQKIANWSHKADFDVDAFFAFWTSLDDRNYQRVANFHPVWPKLWRRLEFLPSDGVEHFLQSYREQHGANVSPSSIRRPHYLQQLARKFQALLWGGRMKSR